jgi:DNA polymerase III sliding clamp (beta) subunit (PCNA family)
MTEENEMLQITTASLKAACLMTADKDARYYLNGVQIQVREDGTVRVRATDGHVAFEDQMQQFCAKQKGPFDLIVPTAQAKEAAKSKQPMLFLEALPEGRYIYILGDILFTPIEGKFPDLDKVMPVRNKAEVLPNQYDAESLVRCQKAMRIAIKEPKAFFRLQHGECGLMHREVESFPRCAVMSLNVNKAFLDN